MALDWAEGVLDGLATLAHCLRVLIEPLLHGFQNLFMLPAADPALLARRALSFQRGQRSVQ
jgi:hypothetical protein